jgi:hypothetical protein
MDLVPLPHNPKNGATGGIWRVRRGTGTAILKIATPGHPDAPPHWATSDEPDHWNHWLREVEAYRSGLAASAYADAGIRAPALLETVERPDGSVGLWLEDVAGLPGTRCTPTQLGDLAERLGAAHAAWLGRSPGYPWLSRDWLRAYTLSRPVREPMRWDHPIAAAWPQSLREDLRALWQRRHAVLDEVDGLPRTLNHHDVWPMNLIVGPEGPVLLDWSFVGPGAVGEDAANLILDTFFDGLVEISAMGEVAAAVTAGYRSGLAGTVDAATVERAIALTGAAKYFWLAPWMLGELAGDYVQSYDKRPNQAVFAGRRPVFELLTRWAGTALR